MLTEYCFQAHMRDIQSHCLWAYSAPLWNSAGSDHCTPHSVTTSLNTAFTVVLHLLGTVGPLVPNILRKCITWCCDTLSMLNSGLSLLMPHQKKPSLSTIPLPSTKSSAWRPQRNKLSCNLNSFSYSVFYYSCIRENRKNKHLSLVHFGFLHFLPAAHKSKSQGPQCAFSACSALLSAPSPTPSWQGNTSSSVAALTPIFSSSQLSDYFTHRFRIFLAWTA